MFEAILWDGLSFAGTILIVWVILTVGNPPRRTD